MLKLLLTRHGETGYNVEGRIQGTIDTELTPEGVRQAGVLADYLSDVHIDYVITGTLKRQMQTGDAVARVRDIPSIRDLRVNERDWGRYNGQHENDIDTGGIVLSRFLFYMLDPNNTSNPDIANLATGETIEQTMARVGSFYGDIIKKYADATLLIVSSQYSNAYLLNSMFGIPNSSLAFFVQENMCLNEIGVYRNKNGETKPQIEVVHINFMEHVRQRKG